MQSKEDQALEPFFSSPKHWHFDELVKRTGISRPQLSLWLKKFIKEGIVKRIKPKRKMPYYTSNTKNPLFQNKKKLFGLTTITESGLLDHISTLQGIKVAILFGSFSKYDWYEHSDIDLFIYGDDTNIEQGKYETILNREIQIHTAVTRKDLKTMDKMLPYILSGNFIKGSIQDLGVNIHAKT